MNRAKDLARLLSLARHKKVAFCLANQSLAQIAAVDANALRVIRTNLGTETWFRVPYEDARLLGHALPPSDAQDSRGARESTIEQLTRLPRRHALLWIRSNQRAHLIRTPRFDLTAMLERAAQAPQEVHDLIAQGNCSERRSVLRRRLAEASGAPERSWLLETDDARENASLSDDNEFPPIG